MTTHATFFGVMFMLVPKNDKRILRRIRVHGRLQSPVVQGREPVIGGRQYHPSVKPAPIRASMHREEMMDPRVA
jgi:hypothetical protein